MGEAVQRVDREINRVQLLPDAVILPDQGLEGGRLVLQVCEMLEMLLQEPLVSVLRVAPRLPLLLLFLKETERFGVLLQRLLLFLGLGEEREEGGGLLLHVPEDAGGRLLCIFPGESEVLSGCREKGLARGAAPLLRADIEAQEHDSCERQNRRGAGIEHSQGERKVRVGI